MNRTHYSSAVSLVALMWGVVACTPSKEDHPPKPKVTASAEAEPNDTASAAARIGHLPKLGAGPAWKLEDLNGKVVSSEQFKGKVVVVDFWATWCTPCRAEIPGYVELTRKYEKDGLVIVGVSLDQGGPTVVKPFAEKFGINYPIVMGDEAVQSAFGGMEAIPTTFIIDRAGQIRHRKVGAEETAEYELKVLAVLNEKA